MTSFYLKFTGRYEPMANDPYRITDTGFILEYNGLQRSYESCVKCIIGYVQLIDKLKFIMLHVTTTQSLHVTPVRDLILWSSFQSVCLNVWWYWWKFTLLFWPLCSRMIRYWLHMISGWIFFCLNLEKKSIEKIEIVIFGPKIDWNRSIFYFQNRARNIVRSCFYQLRQLRSVQRSLPEEARRALVTAFIASCVDYCNAVFYSVSIPIFV